MALGFACINTQLQQSGTFTNRTCRKKTYYSKGPNYASELAFKNVLDLRELVKWNRVMGIELFRVSSGLFPWMDYYDFKELKDYKVIAATLKSVGEMATKYNQRLTFHPGPFNCLASPNEDVVAKTIRELDKHSEQFNMMGFEPSNYNKINIHVGGTYNDKEATLDRFCKNFELLADHTKKRLVIENDDKASEYSVKDLYEGVYKRIGIPITFDYYHHTFNTGGLTEEEALKLAATTWPTGIKQCCHYSESRRKEQLFELNKALKQHNIIMEDIDESSMFYEMKREIDKIKEIAHSDYIYKEINTYGLDVDIVVEAKMKEQAILNKIKKPSYV